MKRKFTVPWHGHKRSNNKRGGLQDVFRNPSDNFKEEVLTYCSFLKSYNVNMLPSQDDALTEHNPADTC